MDKGFPWIPVSVLVASIVWAILDSRQLERVAAEGPIVIPLSLIAILNVGVCIVTGVLGFSTSRKSAEDIARQRGILADEDLAR